jgi:hypothetical protein
MDCNPQGGGSTAPKGTREGPASLFTADRREPFTQELVGAPMEVLSSPLQRSGAMWGIARYPTKGGGGGGARDPESEREPAEPSGSREAEEVDFAEHIASDEKCRPLRTVRTVS